MPFVLIQNEPSHKVLKVHADIEALEYWAEILCPKDDFMITGSDRRSFTAYTMEPLATMYKDMTGNEITRASYGAALAQFSDAVRSLDVDTTSISKLQAQLKKLGRKPPRTVIPQADSKPPRSAAPKTGAKASPSGNNGYKRPKAGTKTAFVWELADEHKAAVKGHIPDRKAFRKNVIEACVRKGINVATATTQYNKWSKSSDGAGW